MKDSLHRGHLRNLSYSIKQLKDMIDDFSSPDTELSEAYALRYILSGKNKDLKDAVHYSFESEESDTDDLELHMLHRCIKNPKLSGIKRGRVQKMLDGIGYCEEDLDGLYG